MAKVNLINILFDAGKGQVGQSSKEGKSGEPFGVLPRAFREGYIFEGWFTGPESDAGARKVTADDPIQSEDDLTLYAHFRKQGQEKEKKKSLVRTQRIALVSIIAAILILAITLPIVTYYVINSTTYVEEGPDGVKYKYYIRKDKGNYVMMDKDRKVLYVNEDGYYTTAIGTLMQVDAATGDYSVYAKVDTEGSEVVGANQRILIFPQMTQATSSGNEDTICGKIEVHNSYGSFTVYRDATQTRFSILGFEDNLAGIDLTAIAYVVSAAGYTLSMQKLDTAKVLENGFEEYGFVMDTNTKGETEAVSSNWYTITSRSGRKSYTVYVGDPLVSGGGCYVKLEGRDAVYVMSNTIQTYLLAPLEDLVSKMLVYPASMNTFFNVRDFFMAENVYTPDEEGKDKLDLKIKIAFSYVDMAARTMTMKSSTSFELSPTYLSVMEPLFASRGYEINSDNCSTVLQNMYSMTIKRCVQYGLEDVTDEELESWGLAKPKYTVRYIYMVDTNEDGVLDQDVVNLVQISEETPDKTFFVLSYLTQEVCEVEESYLAFLNWDNLQWIDQYFFNMNLAFCQKIEVDSPNYRVTFTTDNSASDQSKNISSANIRVFADGEELTYVLDSTTSTGKYKALPAVDNFRKFYQSLLWASIEGGAQGDLSEEQMQAFRDAGDEGAQLVLRIHGEDNAAAANPDHYTENNVRDLVLRFYQYSERRSFMTINGEGEFYVLSSFVEKIISDARRAVEGVEIDSTSKY